MLSDAALMQVCSDISLELTAATDQHAAISVELDSLAANAPCQFSPEHLWSLVRAIKLQGRILEFYLEPEQVSV